MPDTTVQSKLEPEGDCLEQCLIGVDYKEFKPQTYRAVVIESPKKTRRWETGDFDRDLADALRWFAETQPTQVLAWRSSVIHFFQDQRRDSQKQATGKADG